MYVWSIFVGLGIFPWACIKMDIPYSPWKMTTSGDHHQRSYEVQVQEENLDEIICLKLATHLEIMVK